MTGLEDLKEQELLELRAERDELQDQIRRFERCIVELCGSYLDQIRIAEAVRDDAQAASNRDIEAKRTAWASGVQTCINIVKHRKAYYEAYRCDCQESEPSNDRGPGSRLSNGHRPGCKGEAMATKPATFAILDEIELFLRVALERGTTVTPSSLGAGNDP